MAYWDDGIVDEKIFAAGRMTFLRPNNLGIAGGEPLTFSPRPCPFTSSRARLPVHRAMRGIPSLSRGRRRPPGAPDTRVECQTWNKGGTAGASRPLRT